jgi:hypothetical protein
MSALDPLWKELEICPAGRDGWKKFEDICLNILTELFVPPLNPPIPQPRTFSGIDRRDAVFPNRNINADNNWGHLYQELKARMILFEFKNYDKDEVGKDEINQTRNYLTKPMGQLAIVCCSKPPNEAAHIKRNTIFSDEGKVILFITPKELYEMILIKERGEDPSDLILDLIEMFYLQHE